MFKVLWSDQQNQQEVCTGGQKVPDVPVLIPSSNNRSDINEEPQQDSGKVTAVKSDTPPKSFLTHEKRNDLATSCRGFTPAFSPQKITK